MATSKLFNAGFNQLREESGEGGDTGGSAADGGQTKTPESIPMSEVQKLIDQETKGMKTKIEELLSEKKSEQQKRRDAEEEKRRLAEQKAKENGDIESLTESFKQKEEQWKKKLQEYEEKERKSAINDAASKVANEIAEGPNAELLSDFVARRLRYEDGEAKVVDAHGNLTVSSLDDLKREFANDPKFASLVKGTGSSGSGATSQSTNGGAGKKTVTRSQWDDMSHHQRVEFSKSGGEIAND